MTPEEKLVARKKRKALVDHARNERNKQDPQRLARRRAQQRILYRKKYATPSAVEQRRAYENSYRQKNLAKTRASQRRYYQANRESERQRKHAFYLRNKDAISWRTSNYAAKRAKVDPAFALTRVLRSRIHTALRLKVDSSLTSLVLKELGCSAQVLKAHLESLFQPGMTWENRGLHGWHIDHIKPLASFDLADPEQRQACMHFTNLQPLWAKDNWHKSDKLS